MIFFLDSIQVCYGPLGVLPLLKLALVVANRLSAHPDRTAAVKLGG